MCWARRLSILMTERSRSRRATIPGRCTLMATSTPSRRSRGWRRLGGQGPAGARKGGPRNGGDGRGREGRSLEEADLLLVGAADGLLDDLAGELGGKPMGPVRQLRQLLDHLLGEDVAAQ